MGTATRPINSITDDSRRVLIIATPRSYNYSASKIVSVISRLWQLGMIADVIEAIAPDDIGETARKAEFPTIVVAGATDRLMPL